MKKEVPLPFKYSVFASALIAALLIALRYVSWESSLYLDTVRVSNVEFYTARSESALLNETAAAGVITMSGYTTTVGKLVFGAKTMSMERMDQLHIKDLFTQNGTKIRVAIDGDVLGIIVGDSASINCCEGRIGVGDRVLVEIPPARTERIDALDPNARIQCTVPPCSLTLQLQNKEIVNFIQDQPIDRVSFSKAGTGTSGATGRINSSILSGKIIINGIDLLGMPFALRTIDLSPGDLLDVTPNASMLANLDIRDGALFVTGAIRHASRVTYSPRGGDAANLVPSILEIVIREPWHKTIWGIAVALLPLGLQLTRRVLWRNGYYGANRRHR